MIVIKITMNTITSKQLEMSQTLLSMIEPTERAAGCISYGVFCDTKDKNRFCLLEEWKTREELDQHFESHQFSILLGTKGFYVNHWIFRFSRFPGKREWMPFIRSETIKNQINLPPTGTGALSNEHPPYIP